MGRRAGRRVEGSGPSEIGDHLIRDRIVTAQSRCHTETCNGNINLQQAGSRSGTNTQTLHSSRLSHIVCEYFSISNPHIMYCKRYIVFVKTSTSLNFTILKTSSATSTACKFSGILTVYQTKFEENSNRIQTDFKLSKLFFD